MKVYVWAYDPLESICGEDGDMEPLVCGLFQRRHCQESRLCTFSEGDYAKCRPLVVEIRECSKYEKSVARKVAKQLREKSNTNHHIRNTKEKE